MEAYKRGSHTVWDCKYHVVWITKYRYPVLGGDVGIRCRELLRETARAHEMVIHAGSDFQRRFVNAPRFGFVLDAMILADFAVRVDGASGVRLMPERERFPDGIIDTPNGTLKIEVTEVDGGSRRRGDEYKSGVRPRDSITDWQEKANAIPAELERVILKKVNKHYDPKPTLVVYLNLDEYGIRQKETLTIIEEAKRRHASSFEGIHVLWRGKLY
jgi:hypothetical protein